MKETSGAARETVSTAATRVCAAATLEASPFDYADAILALRILAPGRADLEAAVARAAVFLAERGRAQLAQGEDSGATDTFIHAARLAPADTTVLRLLADAAERAGRAERLLETLLRIHRLRQSLDSLTAVVEAAIPAGWWAPLGETMSRAQDQELIGLAASGAVEGLRGRLHDRLEAFPRAGDGDGDGAMALVTGLQPWMMLSDWPAATIACLLSAAKRHLRRPRASAAIGRLAAYYLSLDPGDVDVQRLLARLHLRHRRLRDAAASSPRWRPPICMWRRLARSCQVARWSGRSGATRPLPGAGAHHRAAAPLSWPAGRSFEPRMDKAMAHSL